MPKDRTLYVFYILLPLILLICILLWHYQTSIQTVLYDVNDSEYDLHSQLEEGYIIRINPSIIEFVPNQFLTPEEFHQSTERMIANPDPYGSALTSRVVLQVPQGFSYGFVGFTANYASKLYVNGRLLFQAGELGLSAETMVPGERFLSFSAYPEDGTIEIVQQSSNFVYDEQDFNFDWYIGEYEAIQRYAMLRIGMSMVTIGIYILLFITHFTLYLMQPGNKANLLFALLCLVFVIRTGVVKTKPFAIIFPDLSWTAGFKLEYLSVPAALFLLVASYDFIFKGVLPKWLCYFTYTVSLVFSLIFVFASTFFMSNSIVYLEIAAIIIAIFILGYLLRRVRKPTSDQIIILLGLTVVFISLVLDTLYYNGWQWLIPSSTMEFALMAFALFQMTAMFFVTTRELAELREAERIAAGEKELLADLNRIRSSFYNDLAHELKTPLTVISTNAQFVARQLEKGYLDKETKIDLEDIAGEAQRLARMVSEMVRLTQLQTEKEDFSKLDLGSMIAEIIRMYTMIATKKENKLVNNCAPDLPYVWGNMDQLVQVLINLLTNSLRHTQNGIVSVTAETQAEFVLVKVEDNGEGIAEDLIPLVFERLARGNDERTGLGLSICKAIIEGHGGEIGIESEVNKGTLVWFTLPVRRR